MISVYFLVWWFCVDFAIAGTILDPNSDAGLSLVQVAQKHGYPVQVHRNIRTVDGYLLTIQRIPHGKSLLPIGQKISSMKLGPPVLLMHGLFGGAEHFTTSGPDRSLAFLLADKGYDVWLGNVRGTTHSRYHEWMDPNRDARFWDYSFHEMGIYDLPASIDYILTTTGYSQIFYLGHSQGTLIFWILCSERPEYNNRIRLFVGMAPVAHADHLPHPWLGKLAPFEAQLTGLRKFGLNELFPGYQLMQLLGQIFCSLPLFVDICQLIIFSVAGPNEKQFVKSNVPNIVTSSPEPISMKQFVHLLQGVTLEAFAQYNYGPRENLKRYGTLLPTNYSLERVEAPVAVIYSEGDWFVSPIDIDRLLHEIQNPIMKYKVLDPQFTHIDFLWAKDAVSLVYSHIFAIMQEYR